MKSKNKRAPNAAERKWLALLAEQPCVVCGQYGVQLHEFDQGKWFTSVPLCPDCHTGPHGWHGDRKRWVLHKMDMVKAIDAAVCAAWLSSREAA